jgi:PAS domain S-box-containing protein
MSANEKSRDELLEEIEILRKRVEQLERALRQIAFVREEQHAQENRLRLLLENSADGIMILDMYGGILDVSPAVSQLLGYSLGELVGSKWIDLVHADDVAHLQQQLAACIANPGTLVRWETRAQHKRGEWTCFEGVYANHLAEPGVHGIVCNFRESQRPEVRSQRSEVRDQKAIVLTSDF